MIFVCILFAPVAAGSLDVTVKPPTREATASYAGKSELVLRYWLYICWKVAAPITARRSPRVYESNPLTIPENLAT